MRLIHVVNPTARELREPDRQRRYELKARLQSLLVRRFADEIRVVRGDEPGVVSLFHRYANEDACHAVINELDTDARAWVTYQLDVGADAESHPHASAAPRLRQSGGESAGAAHDGNVSALVAAGERALDDYDFDQAAKHFAQAVQLSHGAVGPTQALLELWVERLGSDREALDLEASLPKETLASEAVRGLLGIAAARLKEIKHADRLVRSLQSPRAAEIMALCVRAACEMGDVDLATRWLYRLRSFDALHPAIAECEREIQRAR